VILRGLFALEIVRYGMISAVAFAVDVALLSMLVQVFGIHYLIAATCSFLLGGVVAYLLSVRFVFRYHRLQVRTLEAAAFVALGLVGLVVNVVVMALAVGSAGAHLLLGKLAAAGCTFGVNYLLRKFVLFSPRGTGSAGTHP
jgi:putative flippase GtrA